MRRSEVVLKPRSAGWSEYAVSTMGEKMKKVFVVSEGCYSDYHICAIFDDEELAKKYCEVHKARHSDYECEEWPVNDWDTEEIARTHYQCWLFIVTGEIKTEMATDAFERPELRLIEYPTCPSKGYSSNPVVYGNSFVSKEHARKIASDRRTILLAEKAEGIRNDRFIRIEPEWDGVL